MREGELETAAAAFERSLALGPSKEAALGLAGVRRRLGDLPSTKAALERALAMDADDGDTWNELGAISMMMEDAGTALSSFRRAAALRPDDALFRHNFLLALSASTIGVLQLEDASDAESARRSLLSGESFDAVARRVAQARSFTVAGDELAPDLVDALLAAERGVSEAVESGGRLIVIAILPVRTP